MQCTRLVLIDAVKYYDDRIIAGFETEYQASSARINIIWMSFKIVNIHLSNYHKVNHTYTQSHFMKFIFVIYLF